MNVAVFGTGYVGCVTAACLSRDGHQVIGVDIDAEKVTAINDRRSPVAEPGLPELISQQVAEGRLCATTDVAHAIGRSQIAMVCVGTPSDEDGSVDCRAVERVLEAIGAALRGSTAPYTVVIRSTLLPGILEARLAPLLCRSAGRPLGPQLGLCNNPEFLRESSAIKDYDEPPFVIVGAVAGCNAQPVLDLYAGVRAEQVVVDPSAAALVKYASNAWHAIKVAFGNEIGSLARSFGTDGLEVMRLFCMDRKLNISPAYLRPGFAFGGSCLPKDLRALARYAQQQALRADLLSAAMSSNEEHLRRAVRMIQEKGCRKVGLVGLSFKAGTDDLRESPQVILAETLLGRGFDLRILDPGVSVSRLRGRNLAYVDQHLPHLAALLVERSEQLFEHAELLVLCTGVADQLNWQTEFQGQVLDLRRDLAVGDVGRG